MSNKEFCDFIQTQSCFTQLINNYKPQLVFLSGSRGVGTNHPHSDYDLIAITSKFRIQSLLGYDDIKLCFFNNNVVHCYVYSLDFCESWLRNDNRYNKPIVSDLWFQNILALQDPNNIIMCNDNLTYEFWFINKEQIIKQCMFSLITKHGEYQKNNLKFLGHCILCLSLLIKQEPPLDFICKIKHLQKDNTQTTVLSQKIWKEIQQKWDDFLTQ